MHCFGKCWFCITQRGEGSKTLQIQQRCGKKLRKCLKLLQLMLTFLYIFRSVWIFRCYGYVCSRYQKHSYSEAVSLLPDFYNSIPKLFRLEDDLVRLQFKTSLSSLKRVIVTLENSSLAKYLKMALGCIHTWTSKCHLLPSAGMQTPIWFKFRLFWFQWTKRWSASIHLAAFALGKV